jgi:Sec-independent protein translocase protein TatA
MFDFDAGKLIIVGIVALIVIGPTELPRVMLQIGQAAAKMRRMAAEFRSQFMDVMREAKIDETKSDVERLAERAKAATGMDPSPNQSRTDPGGWLRRKARDATSSRKHAYGESWPEQCGTAPELDCWPVLAGSAGGKGAYLVPVRSCSNAPERGPQPTSHLARPSRADGH